MSYYQVLRQNILLLKMRIFQSAFLIILISLIHISCSTNNDPVNPNDKVEIYELAVFETEGNSCQIIETSAILKDNPLITYGELLSYNSKEYIFNFSDNGEAIIKNMQHSVRGIPFAITVDDELIYTGYFWPAYSSLRCDWVTIDPLHIEFSGEGHVSVGYPGPNPGFKIPDKRNDPRILEVFRKDGKLIE